MKKIKLLMILLIVLLTYSCQLFLGPQPDSSPRGIFDRIWTDFNETYALFDERGIDWNETYRTYSPMISADMSDYELFRVCAQMLNSLHDPHVGLITPFGYSDFLNHSNRDYDYYSWMDDEPFELGLVHSYLSGGFNSAGDGKFLYGVFKENSAIGYLYISDFYDVKIGLDVIPDWVKQIDNVLESLMDTEFLIVDVRNSWGGFGSNMDYVAGRFAAEQKDYIKFCAKNGPGRGDFSAPLTWSIKPAGSRYIKPIALLSNRETISASEWFVMALRTQSHVTHVGETSCGAFSARIVRPLINGWEYSISILKVTDMDGKCYEGVGISPDEEHRIANNWNEVNTGKDAQLEYALGLY